MKKQTQILLATVFMMNSVSFAQTPALDVGAVMTEAQIKELVAHSLEIEVKDAEDALESVEAIIAALKGFQQQALANEENPTVTVLRSIVTFGGLALQLKKITDKNGGILDDSASLALSALLGAVQTVLDGYKQYNQIDLREVKKVLIENQDRIASSMNIDSEQAALIASVVGDLGKLNADIKTNIDEINNNINEGKYYLAGTAILGLVTHYAAKYLPQTAKEKMIEKVSDKFVENAAKTKNVSQHGLGSTSFLELISMATGLAGEEPQAVLEQTIAELNKAKSELIVQIQQAK